MTTKILSSGAQVIFKGNYGNDLANLMMIPMDKVAVPPAETGDQRYVGSGKYSIGKGEVYEPRD
jgi:hypothetical protein